jgi:hypothetical protein
MGEEGVMTDTQTVRGSWKFSVQEVEGGKQAIVIQTLHDSIGPLRHATLGFNLLSGTTSQQAKKIAAGAKRVCLGGVPHNFRLASYVQEVGQEPDGPKRISAVLGVSVARLRVRPEEISTGASGQSSPAQQCW